MSRYSLAEIKEIPELSGDRFVDKLLFLRGITTKEDTEVFLKPLYSRDIGDPFGIYGMDKAVTRIIEAFKKEEKIAIYSDYDCDGVPGGVLFRDFLEGVGYKNYTVYIPHRIKEGYGMHNHAVDLLKVEGVTLIITVDSGITNVEQVLYAKEQGIDVIVTDHHLPIQKEIDGVSVQVVPDAVAVLNSKQEACTYSDDMLCGSGVVWKLACALLSSLREETKNQEAYQSGLFSTVLTTVKTLPLGWEKWLLDLVGIATVADMVPLQKENRALAYFGLMMLRMSPRPGLKKIFTLAGATQKYLTEEDISFTIAPRVNAASRMDTPHVAHAMLFEKKIQDACVHAEYIEQLNTNRKGEVKDIVGMFSSDMWSKDDGVIVAGDVAWSPGLIGLIAQNIIDATSKVVFVWGKGEQEGVYKGSCRSLGDVHLVELMTKAEELFPGTFVHYGGHEQAGGFAVEIDKVEQVSKALNEALKHVTIKPLEQEEILVDHEMNLDEVTSGMYNKIAQLAPFGVGNAKPLFLFKGVTPRSVRFFGKKNEHLEIVYAKTKGESSSANTLRRDEIKAIQFFAKKETEERSKQEHTLVAHIEKSYFRGKEELRLRIVDIF